VRGRVGLRFTAAGDRAGVSPASRGGRRPRSIDDQFKLRWTIGAAEKPACRVHKNNWTFNTNGGIEFTGNGGVAGPPGTHPRR